MINEQAWLEISALAHSLSGRHLEASYFRPQYYAVLTDSLNHSDHSELVSLVLPELMTAISIQCGIQVDSEDQELVWEAFGIERTNPRIDVSRRASAFKNFHTYLRAPCLPSEVVLQAESLYADPAALAARIMPVSSLYLAERFYRNPLTPKGSLWALANWKLGNPSPDVDIWRDWLTTLIYQQVRFQFVRGIEATIETEDVAQDVIMKVLQRLCVYQPGAQVTLERWVFNIVGQSISMSLRSLRRHSGLAPMPEGEADFLLPTVREPDETAELLKVELVEAFVTKLGRRDRQPEFSRRAKLLVGLLGTFMDTRAPANVTELIVQLKKLFREITEDQIQQIVKYSGLEQQSEESIL